MTRAEYRDLIDGVVYQLASCRSAATPDESVKERARLARNLVELEQAPCKNPGDAARQRAARVKNIVREFLTSRP